jgi:hypothetical protein
MENQLIAEILDMMYGRPAEFELGRHRIVIGIWDEGEGDQGYTVYATIEDCYAPMVSVTGESSYGSDTVLEALQALRNDMSKKD